MGTVSVSLWKQSWRGGDGFPTHSSVGRHVTSFANTGCNTRLNSQVSRTGLAAANRRFTPEFINRLDKIVVFKSLSSQELGMVVDIVHERLQTAAAGKPFLVDVAESAREFLLMEGAGFRYGARPLKRAIERLRVQPVSNLMASGQIHRGGYIRVTRGAGSRSLLGSRALGAWGIADRVAA